MRRRFLTGLVLLAIGNTLGAAAGKEYAMQQVIGEGKLAGIAYVACDSQDRLIALLNSGTVMIYGKDGKLAQEFPTKMEHAAVVAVGPKDALYVLAPKTEAQEVKVSGKTVKREVPVGVICRQFDAKGNASGDVELQGVKSVASGVYSNGKLLVADRATNTVVAFDPATGAKVASIGKGVRTCCGIFGFAVNAKGNILIANLGAFRVDEYTPEGKEVSNFGKRGEDPDSFHGCCNPVNLAVLPDGRLLTAEKSTTRLKVYDAAGQRCEQVIPDVQQLVEGCAYIPMAVDSAGQVYLANEIKGYVVKCGPKGG